jgi:hypothetical protein
MLTQSNAGVDGMKNCSIFRATHVRFRGRNWLITSVWGVGPGPYELAKPSQGGFGCILEDGTRVSMWKAQAYFHDETRRLPARQLRLKLEEES